MKFAICRTSGRKPNVGERNLRKGGVCNGWLGEIEIKTIDELTALDQRAGAPLIVNGYIIEIYDDFRE